MVVPTRHPRTLPQVRLRAKTNLAQRPCIDGVSTSQEDTVSLKMQARAAFSPIEFASLNVDVGRGRSVLAGLGADGVRQRRLLADTRLRRRSP